jgi:hypothetical protein
MMGSEAQKTGRFFLLLPGDFFPVPHSREREMFVLIMILH